MLSCFFALTICGNPRFVYSLYVEAISLSPCGAHLKNREAGAISSLPVALRLSGKNVALGEAVRSFAVGRSKGWKIVPRASPFVTRWRGRLRAKIGPWSVEIKLSQGFEPQGWAGFCSFILVLGHLDCGYWEREAMKGWWFCWKWFGHLVWICFDFKSLNLGCWIWINRWSLSLLVCLSIVT